MIHDTDVAVIGAGAAGLVAALNATGRRVTVLTPDCGEGIYAASELAQGGMAAAIGRDDSPALHLRDTVQAAHAEFDLAAARTLCQEAPGAVAYLHRLGVEFERDGDVWSLHTEAAHSRARVLHVGDATGRAIMSVLRRAIAEAPHVELQPGMRAMSLLRDSERICGVSLLTGDGRHVAIRAHEVVIATGGIGGLFARSTNPLVARGEGVAMALAAGARCSGLEFVQFHPTALDVDERPLPLLTEALRGAGARLIDANGVRLMTGVDPLLDLAPRDVVARAVYRAQGEGRGVLLDATRLECDIAQTFPTAYRICRERGFDLTRTPVPITPAQHYHMGGIAVDLEGQTSVPGLWAVGEAACTGAHGANRLASNSLLEAVVFGMRVGRALSRLRYFTPRAAIQIEATPSSECLFERELRTVMWECMGVVRTAAKIAEGMTLVERLCERTPIDRQLDHAVLNLARHMLMSAARRTTSCGAHYRDDAEAIPLKKVSELPRRPYADTRARVAAERRTMGHWV